MLRSIGSRPNPPKAAVERGEIRGEISRKVGLLSNANGSLSTIRSVREEEEEEEEEEPEEEPEDEEGRLLVSSRREGGCTDVACGKVMEEDDWLPGPPIPGPPNPGAPPNGAPIPTAILPLLDSDKKGRDRVLPEGLCFKDWIAWFGLMLYIAFVEPTVLAKESEANE